MRHLRIYGLFFKQYLKGLVNYRVDFLIGTVAFIINQGLGIIFLYIIFQNIGSLAGFSGTEVVLMYGLSQIPKGIDHLIFDNIWLLPRRIKSGEFDRYLLRPIDPLYAFLIERFQPDAFGELILGTGLAIYALTNLSIAFLGWRLLGLLVFIIIGTFIFTAIKLLTASTAFWIKNCYPLMQITYDLNDYSKYPRTIFPKVIQFIMTFVVPFALVSFFPSLFLLGRLSFLEVLVIILPVTVFLAFLAFFVWKRGLKHYESSGS